VREVGEVLSNGFMIILHSALVLNALGTTYPLYTHIGEGGGGGGGEELRRWVEISGSDIQHRSRQMLEILNYANATRRQLVMARSAVT
jgi:hypothetical protein